MTGAVRASAGFDAGSAVPGSSCCAAAIAGKAAVSTRARRRSIATPRAHEQRQRRLTARPVRTIIGPWPHATLRRGPGIGLCAHGTAPATSLQGTDALLLRPPRRLVPAAHRACDPRAVRASPRLRFFNEPAAPEHYPLPRLAAQRL